VCRDGVTPARDVTLVLRKRTSTSPVGRSG
jgi:hypothetical protein